MYTSCQRHPDNFPGKPLLWARYELMVYVWMAAWPYLTPVSRAMPPNHLQLLFYYWLKGAEMVEHQDNSELGGHRRHPRHGRRCIPYNPTSSASTPPHHPTPTLDHN